MIPNQKVQIRWNSLNKKYYEQKGYIYTEIGDSFEVDLKDLTPSSNFEVNIICDYCGESYKKMYVSVAKSKHNYCGNCKTRRITINCNTCGNPFEIKPAELGRRKTCSSKCHPQRQNRKIKCNCFICRKIIYKRKSVIERSISGNVFCSKECVAKYTDQKDSKVEKTCKICGVKYKVIPSLAEKSVTCSIECQHEWQSIYLRGENAVGFDKSIPIEDRKVNCTWCDKEGIVNKTKLIKIRNGETGHFCSTACRQEWYAKIWSQREQWKEESKIRAVNNLENGVVSKVNSGCQIKLNEMLDDMNISYLNEYNCTYVSIDNYLDEYNLMIEVMGTYWHTDARFYNEINYENQYNRIIKDKQKKGIIKNNYNIHILYLWEEDINNYPERIQNLIQLYIDQKGKIKNYHSFNYVFDGINLKLNNQIIKPYMEYDVKELKQITDIKLIEKKNKKQIDKWIVFNCEYCGEEKEQLISHYNKNKTHCCSRSCSSKLKHKNNIFIT